MGFVGAAFLGRLMFSSLPSPYLTPRTIAFTMEVIAVVAELADALA
jgi:hypothetical protein